MTDLLHPELQTTLAERAVTKAASLLAGPGSTRRRFLYRLAVVGSAFASGPMRYLLRPTPAYASVCGGGNGCDAGWSVFCCTINEGANTCPDNSFVAGWWKVDASAFCLGSPRYYIDCNRRPDKSCNCRCNDTGCDHRRVCCNVFRYGQCNTQIEGVTEVVCRIITCTPPWKWDPSCSRTTRSDNETRSHTSKCLPGKNPSRIEIKYQDLGLVGSVLGRPESREHDAANNGRKRRYRNGLILWHREQGAHEVHGAVADRYRSLGAETSPLGYPRTDHRPVGDGKGVVVRFQRGSIYNHPETGAHAVVGSADARYRRIGGPHGVLGFPTTSTHDLDGGPGRVTRFEHGGIYRSGDTETLEVTQEIDETYRDRGGPRDSRLGFPTKVRRTFDDGGRQQRFERGLIAGAAGRRTYAVHGPIFDRYRDAGGTQGMWGYPVSHTFRNNDAKGWQSRFQNVFAYYSDDTGAHWLNGPILRRYRNEGGPAGELGLPTTDVITTTAGIQQAEFEHGVITYDPTTDKTEVTPLTPAES